MFHNLPPLHTETDEFEISEAIYKVNKPKKQLTLCTKTVS